VTGLASSRVSPFGNPRITVRLPTPRGLSQVPTSFIGSWCQGIHRAPLLTWPQRCSRPLCSSQGTGGPEHLVRACSCDFPGPGSLSESGGVAAAAVRGGGGPQRFRAMPVPSGPNSVPKAPYSPAGLVHPLPASRKKSTEHDRESTTPNNQCSTLELPHRHERPM
jgi:hypothetical protein